VALSRLFNGLPQVMDYLNYAGVPSDRSYGEAPDGQPFYRQVFSYPTPGATNNPASPPLSVMINEWMASNTGYTNNPVGGTTDDWFELYNYGDASVDLGGYYLTDTVTAPRQFLVPTNGHYVIPAHGYLLVWADGKSASNSLSEADLHVNFQLSKSGEAIGLYGADGQAIDLVTFFEQTNNVSQGRYPDGGPTLAFLTVPSPKGPNSAEVSANTAPMLAPLTNQNVTLGQTLTFIAHATDAEAPPQTLSYTLDGGLPAGAHLDTASGQFTWTPTAAQAPRTNQVTVRVTDNGTPPLSVAQTITITVWPRPQVAGAVSGSNGQFQLSFGTVPGKLYRIEYKTDLSAAQWTVWQENIVGTGGVLTYPEVATGQAQRFYRVVQVN
jgi:hypothetical protein